ncbi:MAG: RDD family protein [Thiohalocapsa sp.]
METTNPYFGVDISTAPMIDTLRRFETPEGVDLELRLAGPAPRAAALAIDGAIRLALYLLLTPLMALAGLGIGLFLLALFLVEWFYPVFFELRSGATPGKKAMGLIVVHDDGTPIGPSASVIRNLLRAVDFLPLFYGVGLVSMLVDRDFRRLGDHAAGTLVVYGDRPPGERRIPKYPPKVPAERPDSELQQAILDFAERSPGLSQARCAELAELVTSGQGERGGAAVDQVLGVASWIARGA